MAETWQNQQNKKYYQNRLLKCKKYLLSLNKICASVIMVYRIMAYENNNLISNEDGGYILS